MRAPHPRRLAEGLGLRAPAPARRPGRAGGGPRGEPPVMARYRVEHRGPHGGVLGVLGAPSPGAPAHHRTLDPFAARLRLEGRTGGVLVLVETVSGAVVARRRVGCSPPRQGWYWLTGRRRGEP